MSNITKINTSKDGTLNFDTGLADHQKFWLEEVFEKVSDIYIEDNRYVKCGFKCDFVEGFITVKREITAGNSVKDRSLRIEWNSLEPYYTAGNNINFDSERSINYAVKFCEGKINEWWQKN